MLVLDTDHVSALGFPTETGLRLLERIGSSGEEAVTTIITVEEQLRGWLAEIHRLTDPHRQILAYERLQRRIDFFAARWLIQRQMKGDAELALDRSPLLLWGPYLWAEGTNGRKFDQLVWERADFGPDGVHPSDSGRQKVAELLLNFLANDPLAKAWFTKR